MANEFEHLKSTRFMILLDQVKPLTRGLQATEGEAVAGVYQVPVDSNIFKS